MADLKKEIKEIAEIAKACPEEFRQKCFEVLLNDVLGRTGEPQGSTSKKGETRKGAGTSKAFQDFCRKYSVTDEAVANVFDFASPDNFLQVSDFGQNTKSKQQIVIGLLAAVRALHEHGVPVIKDDAFRGLCESHQVYDKNNFAKHMKSYKKYFIGSGDEDWKLTTVGLKKAAEIINALGGDGAEFKL